MSAGAVFSVGDRVHITDASDQVLRAVIVPVPRHMRDRSRSEVTSTYGSVFGHTITKVWVRVHDHPDPIPWPVRSVTRAPETAR